MLRIHTSHAALILGVLLAGCATWEPVAEAPRDFLVREQPASIVVLRQDGGAIRVRGPSVDDADHILGERWGTRGVAVSISLNAVDGLLAREFHLGRTLVLLLPVSIAVFAAAFAAGGGF